MQPKLDHDNRFIPVIRGVVLSRVDYYRLTINGVSLKTVQFLFNIDATFG